MLIAGGIAVGAVALWGGRHYWAQRSALNTEIARYRNGLAQREQEIMSQGSARKRMEDLFASSLGSTEEAVSALMRTALNEMIANVGLREGTVTTRSPVPDLDPAAKSSLAAFKPRTVRETPDFYEITGTASGKGTLEQAVRMLAMLESQPWIYRVDGFSMRPIGKEREGIEFAATVTTIFAPGVSPNRKPDERVWIDLAPERLVACQSIIGKNVFREPPAAAAPVAAAPPPPPPPVPEGPAYSDWRVTAVVEGRQGPELWLQNQRTGESRMLGAGGEVIGVVFVAVRGEIAKVKIGSDLFEVRPGLTLADRSPASQ